MKNFSNTIKKMSDISDKIAGVFVILVMLMVVANVLLRAAFNSPLKGTFEIVSLLTAVAVALGLAQCALAKGHIAVEFILKYLPKKIQGFVNTFNDFAGFVFWGISTVFILKYGFTMMERGLVTATSEIPVYPFIFLIGIGFLILSLALSVEFVESLKKRVVINNRRRKIEGLRKSRPQPQNAFAKIAEPMSGEGL